MTGTDITSTLSELERKLEELERELATTADDDPKPTVATATAPPVTATAPAPDEDDEDDAPPAAVTRAPLGPPVSAAPAFAAAAAPGGGLAPADRVELVRFGDRIIALAQELADEYAELVARTTSGPSAAAVPAAALAPPAPLPTLPAPVPAPAPEAADPAPTAPALTLRGTPAAPLPPTGGIAPASPGAPLPPIFGAGAVTATETGPTIEGTVTIDAGPFADIATLSQFEQSLARVPGAQDVYVKGFEGDRALIDLEVAAPVALGGALATVSPVPVAVRPASPGDAIRIDIDGGHGHVA